MRYYLDDNGISYGVTTDHREDLVTLPVVLPMIINGMIVSNPYMPCFFNLFSVRM
jgi:hypothetical protein